MLPDIHARALRKDGRSTFPAFTRATSFRGPTLDPAPQRRVPQAGGRILGGRRRGEVVVLPCHAGGVECKEREVRENHHRQDQVNHVDLSRGTSHGSGIRDLPVRASRLMEMA